MEKRKTVNVVQPQKSRGCFIFLIVPFILMCMVIPLCIGAVTLAIVAGAVNTADVVEGTFTAELNNAESAQINITSGIAQVNINPSTDSSDLFTADVAYTGEIDFSEGGDSNRTIRLEQVNETNNFWDKLNILGVGSLDLAWNIGITPDIPIALQLEGGVGELNLSLEELTITDLNLSVDVGAINMTLPAPIESRYEVNIDGGVGGITINLPDNVAVRLEAEMGLGEVNINNDTLQRIDGGNDNNEGNVDGIWETENFAGADTAIIIRFDGAVGELSIN